MLKLVKSEYSPIIGFLSAIIVVFLQIISSSVLNLGRSLLEIIKIGQAYFLIFYICPVNLFYGNGNK
ncbi:hypothetical protein DOS84_12210 [Flavobacterium aquariorum]|uniref:Uncharacterized protein n=1 Tax=Flavobacterium aquariorum TaxID=2217670 RepID=A0A2W7TSB5_9FLAO|nr:hypothetical protein DOS84_12210 [Flavobacterium aquariorum]